MNAALRTAVLFATALCPAATLLRSPYLQNVGADRATVLWVTREPAQGLVQYSHDGAEWSSVPASIRQSSTPSGDSRYQHRADFRGLRPGTRYLYRVLADGAVVRDPLQFRTAAPGAFTFLVLGDSGTGSAAQAEVARRMIAEDEVALVLHVGDISQ
ncbi:MAG: purple acid phosphatase family protein, partial [Bryobacteraceae bacterium]